MKFSSFILTCVFVLVFVCYGVEGIKKKIIKEINLCKRNDPKITECYCTNWNNMVRRLKNGVPEMNIVPIDPIQVQHIKMELPETKSVRLNADLNDVNVLGLSRGKAEECEAVVTDDGIQLYFELYFPEIEIKSNYKAKGKFLLLGIDADGDFHGEFSGMQVKTVWNSTRYMKNSKEHLKFTTTIIDLQMETMKIHFNNLFKNNTELNDNINLTINSSIDLLYEEIKPVVLETIKGISLKIVNDFYDLFPYDVLYPKPKE